MSYAGVFAEYWRRQRGNRLRAIGALVGFFALVGFAYSAQGIGAIAEWIADRASALVRRCESWSEAIGEWSRPE